MRNAPLVALLLGSLLLAPAPARTADLLIQNASLIDGTGTPPRRDVSIRVRDGRIAEIGPGLQPDGATVLDAAGATVLPGLMDAHVHFLFAPGSGLRGDSRATIDELNGRHLRAYLASGVTTVLDAGTTPEAARTLQSWLAAGNPGPRVLTTGPYVRPEGGYGAPMFGTERTPADVERKLDLLQSLGASGVKLAIEDGAAELSDELRTAVIDGAQRRKLPLFVHATTEKTQGKALDLGARAIMHTVMGGRWRGEFFGVEDLSPAFVARMKDSGAFQVTTLSVLDNWPGRFSPALLDDPLVKLTVPEIERESARDPAAYRYFSEEIVAWIAPWTPLSIRPWLTSWVFTPENLDEGIRYSQRNLLALYRAGVPLVIATDAPSPWTASSFHFHGPTTVREIELLGEAGVPPLDAIAAATRNPARMLGIDAEVGTVEVGKRAELVIVDGDPSQDLRALRRVRATVKDGVARTPAQWMAD